MDIPIESSYSGISEAEAKRMLSAMRLSLYVGFGMLLMKSFAYFITGSAAILSDAAESVVHVLAVSFAAFSLRLSLKPADPEHTYGHDRISFFSAGFEGAMIIIAALYIIYAAVEKWLSGLALSNLGTGTITTIIATTVNGGLGWYLVHTGKKYHSIVLEANGKHVLTDSWTSLGVIAALILTMVTGWLPFDPILAIVVATNILWTGWRLIRRSVGGLMDESDPVIDKTLRTILEREITKYDIQYHGLRNRNAGNRLMIEFHLLFNQDIPLVRAHEEATMIEKVILQAFPGRVEIISHLEPFEGHDEFHEKHLSREELRQKKEEGGKELPAQH